MEGKPVTDPQLIYSIRLNREEVAAISRRAKFNGETMGRYIKRVAIEDAGRPAFKEA